MAGKGVGRSGSVERRRRLRQATTVEAAVALGAGLDVREQVSMARNLSGWGAAVFGIAAASIAPGAMGNIASPLGLLEGLTAVPMLMLVRRTWMLQRTFRQLDERDDAELTDDDDELAQLREWSGV